MKNQKLTELFEKWKSDPLYKGKFFFYDGIIDEELFDLEQHKILYICKEPNKGNHNYIETEIIEGYDFRYDWKNCEYRNYPIYRELIIWSYGILNNFPDYDVAEKLLYKKDNSSLKKIAFMNVKKSMGGSTSDSKEIEKYIKSHNNFIHEQINLINPTIIILGLSTENVRNSLYARDLWKPTGMGIDYCVVDDRIIIDFYHPSSRTPTNIMYYYLKEVINKIRLLNN